MILTRNARKRGRNIRKGKRIQDGIDVAMEFQNNSDGEIENDDSPHSVSAEGKSDGIDREDMAAVIDSEEKYNDFGSRIDDTAP